MGIIKTFNDYFIDECMSPNGNIALFLESNNEKELEFYNRDSYLISELINKKLIDPIIFLLNNKKYSSKITTQIFIKKLIEKGVYFGKYNVLDELFKHTVFSNNPQIFKTIDYPLLIKNAAVGSENKNDSNSTIEVLCYCAFEYGMTERIKKMLKRDRENVFGRQEENINYAIALISKMELKEAIETKLTVLPEKINKTMKI